MKKGNKITIEYIARQAMVSPGTVDRVIHSRAGVSHTTRERVLKILNELDYQPDILARTLASRKEWRFAAVLPGPGPVSAFWRLPETGMDAAQREIEHFGVELVKFPFRLNSALSFKKQAERAIAVKPDGIVITPVFAREAKIVAGVCTKLNIPLVYINSRPGNNEILSFVGQDSYASGMVAASLMHACTEELDKIAVINIARDIKNQLHLARREQGFNDHFLAYSKRKMGSLLHITIIDKGEQFIQRKLKGFFSLHRDIKGVFVTNSRVYQVAACLKEMKAEQLMVIGYDLLEESKRYLMEGTISFLISQKPEEQGFLGVMSLFQHLVMKKEVPRLQFLPIDIITKENLLFYKPT